jgi:hypothetical protein
MNLYEQTKLWAGARFHKKTDENPSGSARGEQFTIYGLDNEGAKDMADRRGGRTHE